MAEPILVIITLNSEKANHLNDRKVILVYTQTGTGNKLIILNKKPLKKRFHLE